MGFDFGLSQLARFISNIAYSDLINILFIVLTADVTPLNGFQMLTPFESLSFFGKIDIVGIFFILL